MMPLPTNDMRIQAVTQLGPLGELRIRTLEDLKDLREVYRLTHNCYVTSGYCASERSGLIIHYPQYDHVPETMTLLADRLGRVAGSISVTEDGPMGFTMDEDFKAACDEVRSEGRKIAAIWRLVVAESERSQRLVVLGMMRTMIDWMLEREIATALFVVNPRHESVYRRLLNAEQIAYREETQGLKNAPGILLRFDPAQLPRNSPLYPERKSVVVHRLMLDTAC